MYSTPKSRPEFISTAQAARQLGLSLGAVQQMVESGTLAAWKTAGGHRRIHQESIDSLLASSQTEPPVANRKHNLDLQVTVIEADPVLQQLYRQTFASWQLGIELRIFNHAYDALLALGHRPAQLLIVDLLTPGVDGRELIQRLRNNPRSSSTAVALVSDLADNDRLHDDLPADITIYQKPVPFHQLHGYIEALIAHQVRSHAHN